MFPIPAEYAVPFALITGVFLAVLGILFAVSPQRGLALTKHQAEHLPTIMAGRYFFMVFIAVGVALTGTLQQLAYVFLGLAAVAFFDAATYARAKTAVLPHIVAGIGAVLVAVTALEGKA